MECPKCKQGTCVKVTKDDKRVKRERRGIVTSIIGFPFFAVRALWRLLFGRRQKYEKKLYWHCNYCGNDFADKPQD